MKEINVESMNQCRGSVIALSKMIPVGAQFYTVGIDNPKDSVDDWKQRKNIVSANPKSPELFINRPPQVVKLRTENVISQEFAIDQFGNNCVVFNRGTKSEATAAIVAGETDFGQATDEAINDVIHGGQNRIFADGVKTLTMANSANNAELTRWTQIRDMAQRYIDSIKSTIQENVAKVEQYNKNVEDTTPKVTITTGNGPVAVTVGA